jgi:uncharacterized membrane protein
MQEITHPGSSRNESADLLKGIAVILMIQVHIMEQFSSQDLFGGMAGKVSLFLGGPFCAPVFMAVMGYFLGGSSRKTVYFIKRGLLLFTGGILLNAGRSANLMFHVARGEFSPDPWSYLFGADILTLAGLSMLIIPILRLVFGKNWWAWSMAALAVATTATLLPDLCVPGSPISYPLSFFGGNSPWSYFPLFPWFSYILMGYAFRLLPENLLNRVRAGMKDHRVSVPLVVAVILTIPYAANITCDLQGKYYHHGLLFFLWMILFLAAWVPVILWAEKRSGNTTVMKFIKWTGKNVTVIYIIQWLIIGNLATELYKTQNLAWSFLWFLIITALSALLTWIYKKMIFPGH